MDPGADIVVRKRKFDGSVKSEWSGELLPTLSDGWVSVLHDPPRHLKRSAGEIEEVRATFVRCFWVDRPLAVLLEYGDDGRFVSAKCDASLPAEMLDRVISFTDLDLDLIVDATLSCHIRDEGTFDRRRRTMSYSAATVHEARTGLGFAARLVEELAFPFDASMRSLPRARPGASYSGRRREQRPGHCRPQGM